MIELSYKKLYILFKRNKIQLSFTYLCIPAQTALIYAAFHSCRYLNDQQMMDKLKFCQILIVGKEAGNISVSLFLQYDLVKGWTH